MTDDKTIYFCVKHIISLEDNTISQIFIFHTALFNTATLKTKENKSVNTASFSIAYLVSTVFPITPHNPIHHTFIQLHLNLNEQKILRKKLKNDNKINYIRKTI